MRICGESRRLKSPREGSLKCKRVKELLTKEFSNRLDGVEDALVVNVIGIGANETVALRRQLREKNINLMVVKNGLARSERRKALPWQARFDRYRKAAWHLFGAAKTSFL